MQWALTRLIEEGVARVCLSFGLLVPTQAAARKFLEHAK